MEIVNPNYEAQQKSIRNALNVDFYLSKNLSSEILSNFVDFETSFEAVRFKNQYKCFKIQMFYNFIAVSIRLMSKKL